MVDGKVLQKVISLGLAATMLSACLGDGSKEDQGENIVVVTQAVEVVEEKGEDGVVVTQEVVVEQLEATSTPPQEPTTLSSVYDDEVDDCATPAGEPIECAGVDIVSVILARIESDIDLSTFNQEAEGAGFMVLDMPLEIQFPFYVAGIRVGDFDPNTGFLCINWGDQQPDISPTEPDVNVVATCVNPLHEFVYVNTISFTGEPGVEADPGGTQVITDPDKGVTFLQDVNRVFIPQMPDSIGVIMVANDNSQHDQLRTGPEILLIETEPGPS
jgi:hypothetical protein